MPIKRKTKKLGFTLIEMIVSLSIFAIVVTTAVGAMLILISTNQQLQAEQSVMTNLSFALDTMTREIRTGFNYYCAISPGDSGVLTGSSHESLLEGTKDCVSGRGNSALQGISFYEGGNSITGTVNRILYYYDFGEQSIFRRVGNRAAEAIVSSGVDITDAQFYVTGTTDLESGSDAEQPTVTIYIKAKDANSSGNKEYYMQTTVTQRILDL